MPNSEDAAGTLYLLVLDELDGKCTLTDATGCRERKTENCVSIPADSNIKSLKFCIVSESGTLSLEKGVGTKKIPYIVDFSGTCCKS